jgi:hypothetical protein
VWRMSEGCYYHRFTFFLSLIDFWSCTLMCLVNPANIVWWQSFFKLDIFISCFLSHFIPCFYNLLDISYVFIFRLFS